MGGVRCPVLVGRETETALLRGIVRQAGRRCGGAAVLVGEAGVGKSRLLADACAHAEQDGALVLRGRAVPATVPVPHRPLVEALQAGVRRGALRPGQVAPRGLAAALATLLPGVDTPSGAVPAGGVVGRAEAVLALLGTAGRPVVVALEDLHWADPDTLSVLEYLCDALDGTGVALLATTRGAEEPGAALELATALGARGAARVVEVPRLTPEEVARVADACLGGSAPTALRERLARHADGLPFLVEELVGDDADVPRAFGEAVQARLRRLDPATREGVHAAAVLGRDVDWALLAGVLGAGVEQVAGHLRRATDAGLLAQTRDGVRFRHALTRDAVLAALLPPERAALARAGLAALEACDPALPGTALAAAAALAAAGGLVDRAVALHREAAARARACGAVESAAQALRSARTLLPDGHPDRLAAEEELLQVLADAGRAGEVPEVAAALLTGLPLGDGERRAAVHLRLAAAAAQAGDWPRAEAELARVHAASDGADPLLRARTDLVAAFVALGQRRLVEAEWLAERAGAVGRGQGAPELEVEADVLLGRVLRTRDLDAADRVFGRAREVAREAGMPLAALHALHELATDEFLRVRPPVLLREVLAQADELGAVAVAGTARHHLAVSCCLRGEVDEGRAWAERSVAHARRYRLDLLASVSCLALACCAAVAGDDAAVHDALHRAGPGVAEDPELAGIADGSALAVLALGREERAEALALLDRAVAGTAGRGLWTGHPLYGLWSLACAVERGAAGLDRHPPEGPAVCVTVAALEQVAQAVLAGAAGDGARACALLAEADALGAGAPWYRHVALRLAAEAALRDGWGEPAAWLAQVVAWAEGPGGLPRLAAGARELLRAAGAPAPPQRRALAPEPALAALGVTARESEVLALLVQGATNREVAARLFLSPRTVEKHVERLLAKTGAPNRAALAVRAVGLGAHAGT